MSKEFSDGIIYGICSAYFEVLEKENLFLIKSGNLAFMLFQQAESEVHFQRNVYVLCVINSILSFGGRTHTKHLFTT